MSTGGGCPSILSGWREFIPWVCSEVYGAEGETATLRVERASDIVPSQQATLICPGSAHVASDGDAYLLIFAFVLFPTADHTCPCSAAPPATQLVFCVWPASSSSTKLVYHMLGPSLWISTPTLLFLLAL